MHIKTLASALALVLSSQFAHAAVFFDTRFASPPNIIGQPIVVDGTSATPSRVNMGSVEVAAGFAGQAGNWAIFNGPTCAYDQIEFILPAGLGHATVEWDMIPSQINGSQSSFSVLLDSTDYSARSVSMHSMGSLRFFSKNNASASIALQDQRKYHVVARIDVPSDLLEIYVNDQAYYKGSFGSSNLSAVRFNLSPSIGGATNCTGATAALSNVKIYENSIDLQTPPVQPKLNVLFTPNGAAVPQIPALGGQLNFKRTVTNFDVQPLTMTTWIGTTLADGTGFTLGGQQNATLAPATNLSNAYTSVPIPRWLPAGPYKARLSVVNINTNEITTRDIQFIKLP